MKEEPVEALPLLVIVELKVVEEPAVAEVGVGAPATRSGAGQATVVNVPSEE